MHDEIIPAVDASVPFPDILASDFEFGPLVGSRGVFGVDIDYILRFRGTRCDCREREGGDIWDADVAVISYVVSPEFEDCSAAGIVDDSPWSFEARSAVDFEEDLWRPVFGDLAESEPSFAVVFGSKDCGFRCDVIFEDVEGFVKGSEHGRHCEFASRVRQRRDANIKLDSCRHKSGV